MKKIFLTILITISTVSCAKTIIAYDEELKHFVTKKGKEVKGTIIVNKGDTCQVVDNIFVVCSQ
tara:strand:- start:8012 stop:8203 length:192 start_codon:yes stop_codon:yes gene_type:complete